MDRKNTFLGSIMVIVGLLMGLRALNLVPEISLLFILAGAFLAAYFVFHRNVGFLIPGCILTAIAAFTTLEQSMRINGVYFLIFLGLAFMAIFLIHTMHIKDGNWGEKNWPLIPGTVLIVIGTLGLSGQQGISELEHKIAGLVAPAFLILVGLAILFSGRKK